MNFGLGAAVANSGVMTSSVPPSPLAEMIQAKFVVFLRVGVLMLSPYFSAGFGLMGVGVGLNALRRGWGYTSNILRRRLLVSLEISNRDTANPWFLTWMADAQTRSPIFLKSHHLSLETQPESADVPFPEPSKLFNLVAGPGTHWFRYGSMWVMVDRHREVKTRNYDGTPWETVTLTTLSRHRHFFPELLAQARIMALKEVHDKLVVYTADDTYWSNFGPPRAKRKLSSVITDGDRSQRILRDLRAFLSRGKWYANRGIPYRRGYLLHGPPGSGKSSFIRALAGELSYNICILNLSDSGLTDSKLMQLLIDVPARSFVLIEDVDAVFNQREQSTDQGQKSSLTFSGFLNALDGVASSEERILFMTTNHPEKLDPALIRPGRVDVLEYFGDATPAQTRQLYLQFYRQHAQDELDADDEFAHDTRPQDLDHLASTLETVVSREAAQGRTASMASIQGHFLKNTAADAARSFVDVFPLPASGSTAVPST